MTKITTALAAEFKQVFTQELQANGGYAVVASSVTNKVAADQILRRWADTLRKHLEAVQPPPGNATPAVN